MSNSTPPNRPLGPQNQPYYPPAQPGPQGPTNAPYGFQGQPNMPGGPGPFTAPPAPPAKKGRWFTSKPVVAGGALIIGLIIGGAGGGESTVATAGSPIASTTVTATSEATTTATATVTAKADPAPTKTVTVEKTVTSAPEPDEEATDEDTSGQVEDGTYIIGEDIQAGTYRTVDPVSGGYGLCYADVQTEDGDYLEQEVTDAGKTVIKVSSKGYTFKSSGCGSWERVK